MPRKWIDGGTGTILLRKLNEDKPKKHKKRDNEEAINQRNEVRNICLSCDKEKCDSGNYRRFRKNEK